MSQNQKSNSNKNKKNLFVPLFYEATKRKAKSPVSKRNTQKNGNPIEPRWSVVWRGWLIVLFTAIVAVYTMFLYSSAVEQSRGAIEASESAKKSAIAAERSVEIARENTTLMERAAKLQSRAWVIIEDVQANKLEGGREFRADIIIQNSGPTPAFRFTSKSDFWLVPVREVDEFMRIPLPVIDAPKGATVIAPRTTPTRTHVSFTPTPDQFASIMKGDSIIVLRIIVDYFDVWGDHHRDEFPYTFAPMMALPDFVNYNPTPKERKQ